MGQIKVCEPRLAKNFGPDVATAVCNILDEIPAFTLNQISTALSEVYEGLQVSTSTIDRLRDGHGYTLKLATPRPVDRNRNNVKRERKQYAQWLQNQSTNVSRVYVDETNFNVRGAPEASPGRSAERQPYGS
ncbi:hypothetical protein MTO96_037890 [Rhipicephalus appendiculatus]